MANRCRHWLALGDGSSPETPMGPEPSALLPSEHLERSVESYLSRLRRHYVSLQMSLDQHNLAADSDMRAAQQRFEQNLLSDPPKREKYVATADKW